MADIVNIGLRISAQGAQHLTRVRSGLNQVDAAAAKAGITMQNLKRGVIALGAAGVGLAILSKKLLVLGSDAIETRNKFTETLGAATESVDMFLSEFNKISGLSKTASENLVADMAHIAQGFGFTQQASADFAVEIVKLAGDLASLKNVGAEQAAMAITSALTGEREQLKRLGIILRQVDVDRRALTISDKEATSALNDQDRATASMQLITERAGVAMGDLARTSDSTANVMKQLGAAWKDLNDKVGTFLSESPMLNEFLRGLRDMFKDMTTILNGQADDIRQLFEALGDIAGSAFAGGITGTIAKMFKDSNEPLLRDIGRFFDRRTQMAIDNINGAVLRLSQLAAGVAGRPAPRTANRLSFNQLTGGAGPVFAPGGAAVELGGINVTAQAGAAPTMPGFRLGAVDEFGRGKAESFAKMLERIAPTMIDFNEEATAASDNLKRVAIAGLQASQGLVQLLRGSQGAGGVVSGILGLAGGIAGVANPLVGAALLAGGTLLGAATASKPTPVSIENYGSRALSQRRDNDIVTNQTIIIETGGVEVKRIMRQIRRQELRDGTVRIS